MKKLIIAIAFCATPAFATELKVPPLRSGPPAESRAACLARIQTMCAQTHRTKLFTWSCERRNRYRCRGL